jgi:alkylhydroperoxidase family enzyme
MRPSPHRVCRSSAVSAAQAAGSSIVSLSTLNLVLVATDFTRTVQACQSGANQQRGNRDMARLSYREKSDLPAEHQNLLARNINLFRLMTHSIGGARAFSSLGGYIRHGSTLDGRLRELAILQVGWVARSPYEWSHHVKIGHEFGVTDADIQALIDDTAGRPTMLDATARSVLRAAREITVGPAVSEAAFAELRTHFSDEHLTDLVITMSFYSAVVRFLATMQIDVEPEYQPYLNRFPLPHD